ncbi:helix-turn-helix domain-containing protein [Streptomyces sp. CA-249302]|uniref:helix-turn-helix domain-containing protein n=1 Tax=Streptomyces sp. CA-249302 TaxID=3240058 RepID=UPI003D90C4F9
MSDFGAIDALLAGAGRPSELPPAGRRRVLREELNVSRAQLAQALGVSPSTVSGWEKGRDPGGDVREKYAYFLRSAEEKLRPPAQPPTPGASVPAVPVPTPAPQTPGTPGTPSASGAPGAAVADDDQLLPAPRPCVLCGAPATQHVEGYPQHLDPADCAPTTPSPSAPTPLTPDSARTPQPAPAPAFGAPAPVTPASPEPEPEPEPEPKPEPRQGRPGGRVPDLVQRAVEETMAAQGGDVRAAAAALQRRAIPDAMALLDACRINARYDVVGHPPLPDILRRKSAHGADDVWEARPHWTRPDAPPDGCEVTALDINGAYLSALKTHLPLGALEYSTGGAHSRRRAGIHLITPPDWEHGALLPNPLGSREEPGPVWVTEPVLRLLQRLATDAYGRLCDPPVIHESWTSGSTEQLFEKFRQILRDAREKAITENDEVTLEYVKSMYSKFVSTMGESNFNRAIYRPDWMHIIRSQAFVNLWLKAHRAHTAGLSVMRVMGTDELHVAGDWRGVFTEGRGVSQVKVKDVYTLPADERQGL